MGWSETKPKRKKKRATPNEFAHLKAEKRVVLISERKKRNLTQAQLAKLVGCTTAMISHLESGRANPGVEISMKLEQVLGKTFFELFPDL